MATKQAMPFLTVDAIIGNQAFENGRCISASVQAWTRSTSFPGLFPWLWGGAGKGRPAPKPGKKPWERGWDKVETGYNLLIE